MADIYTPETRAARAIRPSATITSEPKFGPGILGLIKLWHFRAQSRRELSELPAERLQDLGIEKSAVWAETAKPFWR